MRTKVETTYICEICGATFNSESMCRNHEENEKLLLECRFWDSDRNELKVKNWDYECPEDAYYLYAPTEAHLKAVNKWFGDYSLEQIISNHVSGVFTYKSKWINIDELIEKYTNLKKDLMEN